MKRDIYIGRHNTNIARERDRLLRGGTYRDLSTVMVVATRGVIAAKVVQSWLSLMTPMNQKFLRIFVEKHEVATAYNEAVECILGNSELSKWKYMLTVEDDNCPPPDGLMKLYESMKQYDVVQGLYWTKGENGQPMVYGDPKVFPRNYIPQVPIPNAVQEANGLGMGFNLFKLEMFKKIPKPWFKTVQEYKPGEGSRLGTQDLYFYDNAGRMGYRFACDTRVQVGHWDNENQILW